MPIRLIASDGKIVAPEMQTIAFAFFPGGLVACCDGVEVTPAEAMMRLAANITKIREAAESVAESISQPGALP